jgi:hypothetical protein
VEQRGRDRQNDEHDEAADAAIHPIAISAGTFECASVERRRLVRPCARRVGRLQLANGRRAPAPCGREMG